MQFFGSGINRTHNLIRYTDRVEAGTQTPGAASYACRRAGRLISIPLGAGWCSNSRPRRDASAWLMRTGHHFISPVQTRRQGGRVLPDPATPADRHLAAGRAFYPS